MRFIHKLCISRCYVIKKKVSGEYLVMWGEVRWSCSLYIKHKIQGQSQCLCIWYCLKLKHQIFRIVIIHSLLLRLTLQMTEKAPAFNRLCFPSCKISTCLEWKRRGKHSKYTHTKNHLFCHQLIGIVGKIRMNVLQYMDYLL